MPDTGKLHLRVIWDGHAVRGVEVNLTRPQAYRLLEGRMPDQAVKMVPLLYSVCGKAQHAAAIAAVSAAQGIKWQSNKILERSVICEAMQEHLWRLLLDWPNLLGIPPAQQQFIKWHGALNEIAAGRGEADKFLAELFQILLGCNKNTWQQIDSYATLSNWINSRQGWLTPIFSAIIQYENLLDFVAQPLQTPLMPGWTAVDVFPLLGHNLDCEFAAKPRHEGKPMETGALAHNQHSALLQDLLLKFPTRLLARVIARLIDLLDSAEALASENMSGRVQGVSASDATGLSVVKTARGMLLHYVSLEAERVANYMTVAPTEWNFHPAGALASSLTGLKESDAGKLMETVKYVVLSLDPCVEYGIELNHA